MLSGSGSIGGLVVNAGGTVSPGYSPGTLTVNGDIAFAAGSTYVVDVAASGAHDLIAASGTASAHRRNSAGERIASGANPFTTYAILTAVGGVSGTFDRRDDQLRLSSIRYSDLRRQRRLSEADAQRRRVHGAGEARPNQQGLGRFGTESLGLRQSRV